MSDLIQIRRTFTKPDFEGTLKPGELAYSYKTNKLFIGAPITDPPTPAIEIGSSRNDLESFFYNILLEFTTVKIVIE